uniref:Galectin n=1 Tax=Salmo trutta TaxID=8032 RepID=A0A673YFY7_SALTR
MQGVVVKNMSFKLGQTLTITGIPNSEATHFVINVGNSEDDLALHMNPRRGVWMCVFAFNLTHADVNVLLSSHINITFTKEQFLVALPDGLVIHFPNRQRDENYK